MLPGISLQVIELLGVIEKPDQLVSVVTNRVPLGVHIALTSSLAKELGKGPGAQVHGLRVNEVWQEADGVHLHPGRHRIFHVTPGKLDDRCVDIGQVDEAFDFEELSRLSLGDHWGQRSEAERAEFVTVFSSIISEKNFNSFVDYYRDGDIVYDREEIQPPRASVHATVPLEAETVGITYRLLRHAQSWRVYDLVIDDVSTADSNRRQYARYIDKHSFEKLMSRLKKQLAKLESR